MVGQTQVDFFCLKVAFDILYSILSQLPNPWTAGLPVGVCALAEGIPFPVNQVPAPAAYFPLSNYSSTSWPLPQYGFFNSSNEEPVSWTDDFTFGEVVQCNVSPPLLHGHGK